MTDPYVQDPSQKEDQADPGKLGPEAVEAAPAAPAEEQPAETQAGSDRKRKKKEKKKKTLGQEILSWVGTLLLSVVLAMTIRALLFEPIRVDGKSMLETLQDGEIVLVTKPSVLLGNFKRGEVVICRFPGRNTPRSVHLGAPLDLQFVQHELFVKRLVALPGDSVAVQDGKLYVNDALVQEDYIVYPPMQNFGRVVLGEDQYMVMGDNRASSHDSRSRDVGPISRDMIVGKAVYVLLPLNKIRPIR